MYAKLTLNTLLELWRRGEVDRGLGVAVWESGVCPVT